MPDFDNTNRGGIWKNDRKETDSHPDFTGNINVEGVDYFLNGWRRKEGANPKSAAMSFSVKRKDKQGAGKPIQDKPATADDFPDDTPF